MSDSNRVLMRWKEETTWGTAPVVAGTPDTMIGQAMRYTNESLHLERNTEDSTEISTDRQTTDVAEITKQSSGDIGLLWSYGTHDDFGLEGNLMSDWSTATAVSGVGLSAANADNSFNDSGNGFGNISAGDIIKTSGFSESANNGYFKVVTAAVGKVTVSWGTLADDAGDAAHKLAAQNLVIGTTAKSYTVERSYPDLTTPLYALYTGVMVNSMSMQIAQGIISATMSLLGQDETVATSSQFTSTTAATTTRLCNGSSHVYALLDGGTATTSRVASFNWTHNNNLEMEHSLTSIVASGRHLGGAKTNGDFSIFFEDNTLYAKWAAFTETDLCLILDCPDGGDYAFYWPSIFLSAGAANAGGQHQAVMGNFSFMCKKDSTNSRQFQIAKFAAAAA